MISLPFRRPGNACCPAQAIHQPEARAIRDAAPASSPIWRVDNRSASLLSETTRIHASSDLSLESFMFRNRCRSWQIAGNVGLIDPTQGRPD